ncbi:MAG: 3-deoxy-7-phosphoheptulonate synthase [Microcystaceae cyanobacterium]
MIIVMKVDTPKEEIEKVCLICQEKGFSPRKIEGDYQTIIGLVGETATLETSEIEKISESIEKVMRVEKPYKLAGLKSTKWVDSEVAVSTPNGVVKIGKNHPIMVVAGPCSVEGEEMIIETARRVKAAGAQFLRGGAYKPRTSYEAFQGKGREGLRLLQAAKDATGLGIITEVMDAEDIDAIAEVADIIQIGARNMQNFSLLKKVGAKKMPVLLKRGMSATIDEWLRAAEYILHAAGYVPNEGSPNVILCERGIRTFDSEHTRNTLDLSVIPVLRDLTHLPIMIDPSHGTGKSDYVSSMAMAAIAADTDSLMIEVHPNPAQALSDGPQSLTPEKFDILMTKLAKIGNVMGRWPQKVAVAV